MAGIQCGNGNCFLIKENDKAILVDTSRTKFIDKILNEYWSKNMRLLILTYGHTNGSIGITVDQMDFIVGDALMNIFYSSKLMLYNNRNDMEKSANKISNSPAKITHFEHGKSVQNREW